MFEYHIAFPVGIDRHDGGPIPATIRRYGLRARPSTVLIDRDGQIRFSAFGAVDDLLGAQLGQLIAQPHPGTGTIAAGNRPSLRTRFTLLLNTEKGPPMTTAPAGYTQDDPDLAKSPVSLDDLELIQKSLLWTDADKIALRKAGEILDGQTDAILDVWYGFVGSNPHLVAAFAGSDGQPDPAYLAAVRERFGRWIHDLCNRDFDETWLAYQEEIGLRHTPSKKNQTDDVASPADHVELRHLIALAVPITVTIRDFLKADGADADAVDDMYHAWFKAVMLSVALWARPYSPQLW